MGILLLVIMMVQVFLLLMFILYLTRKNEILDILIPEEAYHQAEIKSMRKQYAGVMGILSVITLGVFIPLALTLNHSERDIGILFGVTIAVYMVISFLICLYFHGKMKVYKRENKWSEKRSQLVTLDTGFRNQKLTYSNHWFWISFVIAIVTMIITLTFYRKIPEQIPIHYNFAGEVTNYAEKTYRS